MCPHVKASIPLNRDEEQPWVVLTAIVVGRSGVSRRSSPERRVTSCGIVPLRGDRHPSAWATLPARYILCHYFGRNVGSSAPRLSRWSCLVPWCLWQAVLGLLRQRQGEPEGGALARRTPHPNLP